jgi:hypothetical protein
MTRTDGGALKPEDLAVTAGWGYGGGDRPAMPGGGRITERTTYAADELDQLGIAAKTRGEKVDTLLARLGPPVDVWLNDAAYWRAVPLAVWEFRIGGYQVFKKWLSYREAIVLGRPLTLAEAHEATGIIRRIAAIIIIQPELDANYQTIREGSYTWP